MLLMTVYPSEGWGTSGEHVIVFPIVCCGEEPVF